MGRAGLTPLIVGAVILTSRAHGYYQYVHYLRSPFTTPVYEKFDLNALPNKTLTFFVTDSGPANYANNDDFASVLNQVRQAAAAWNAIDSSDLRVAFGGLESQPQTGNTPAGDVIFQELPPGLLGLGGVNPAASPVNSPGGAFFPVNRSLIVLTSDTTQAPGPSYSESFFTTAVHEMGHALGLQHTWTSAAMSQDVIRNTSRARPIDADDMAGLSVLYGKAKWADAFGSISGRVTANGQAVALASVVAIPQIGPALSTLTNPDGSYTINGLPPNAYLIYVHPLPPDAILANNAGLKLPVDANGQTLAPFGSAFGTIFYPGTNKPQQAKALTIAAGSTITGIDFNVTPQKAVSMYDMVTYSFSGSASVTPAYVTMSSGQITVVTQANYGTTPIPQSITILGGFATATQCQSANNIAPPCFLPYNNALAIYLRVPPFSTAGPRHIVFTLSNGDVYVLPDGVVLTQSDPPVINSITQNGDGTVTVTGTRFASNSRVFFDGAPGAIQSTDGQSVITVTPPTGYSGQNASVIVYNGDGQNSTFYQSQAPPLYTYPTTGTALMSVDTVAVPAGVASVVNINGVNTQFIDGQVTLGFGTSDVLVRRVWVTSPTHLVANVVVAPGAAVGSSEISVISGFQTVSQPGAFFVQQANSSVPSIALPLTNADPSQTVLYPGATVSMYGSNLAASGSGVQLTLNDQPVQLLFATAGQINFVIPPNFPTGLAMLKLNNGAAAAPPIAVEIDSPPDNSANGKLK